MATTEGLQLGRPSGSPFAATVPSLLAATAYAAACLMWVFAGDVLPGGRWFTVHLFTLGVLTNLVLSFTLHFAGTLTHATPPAADRLALAANLGVLLTLAGRAGAGRWALGAGGTVVTVTVLLSYVRLRRLRRATDPTTRLLWIVRMYERAHGAFIHGATLGILMGVGVLRGSWAGTARLSHLHVNVLGWGGLTVLATLVFFGPALVRARMRPGADDRAAAALRRGATSPSPGVLLLLASAVGGRGGDVLRLLAAVGIAALATAAVITCRDVLDAAIRGRGAARFPVAAVAVWFPVALWADVLVLATGRWRYLDGVGAAVMIGGLAQLLAAVVGHVAPVLRPRRDGVRDEVRRRVEAGAGIRTVLLNVGAVAITVVAAVPAAPGWAGTVGWMLTGVALAWLGLTAAAPVRPNLRSANRL